MTGANSFLPRAKSLAALCAVLAAGLIAPGPVSAGDEFYEIRTNKTDFKYYDLGRHVPARAGRKPFSLARFVAAPHIGLPMEINPKAGEQMYCNTQVYNLGGFAEPKDPGAPREDLNSPENYYFPWTSNFCEKRGRPGDASACGTQYKEHMGQDCRPSKPTPQPTFWVTAVDDGIARDIGAGHSIAIENDKFRWVYLHMANRQVQPGQQVQKGQRLGKVWNVYKGGTSIHLHIELKYKDRDKYRQLDPLPSLIAAYHRALGNDVAINEDGTLAFDPRFEIRDAAGGGTTPADTTPVVCSGAGSRPSIGTETQFTFTSLWCHNNSLMGLVEDGTTRKLVYYKPRNDDIASAVRSEPVLAEATVTNGTWTGKVRHYSARCGNRQYDVAGTASSDDKRLDLLGQRDSFAGKTCDDVKKVSESLAFSYAGPFTPGGGTPSPGPVAQPVPTTPAPPVPPAPGPVAEPAPTTPAPTAPGPVAQPVPTTPAPGPVAQPVPSPPTPPAPGPVAQPAPAPTPAPPPGPVAQAPAPNSPAPPPANKPAAQKSLWDLWVQPYIDWWNRK